MADLKLGIIVDTDTRATKQEFSSLRREIKREADAMGGDWEAAADKVEDALKEAGARDDLVEAARRIGKEGPSEIEKMQRALRDVGDDSRTLSNDIDDAAAGIKGSLSDAAESIGDAFEENALEPDDLVKAEVIGEIVQNVNEAGAEVARGFKDGFDGEDMETILDGVTDTIVSVGAIGGPLGSVAGVAGATTIQAFVGPFLQKAQETAEQFEDTYSEAFSAIVENGAQMGRELAIQASVDAFAQDMDKMTAATDAANQIGVERGIVLRAMAGDTDALNIVTERYATLNEEQAAAAQQASEEMLEQGSVSAETAEKVNDLNQKLKGQNDLLGTVTGSYETNTDALNAAREAAEAKAEADSFAAQQATNHALATAASTGAAQTFTATIDGATRTLQALPDGKVIDVEADGVELTQAEIDGIRGRDVSIRANATNTDLTNQVLNSVATQRTVPFYMQGSYWQAQQAADRTAASVRPPTIHVNMTYGMRAV